MSTDTIHQHSLESSSKTLVGSKSVTSVLDIGIETNVPCTNVQPPSPFSAEHECLSFAKDGAKIIFATDDWFAVAENLLQDTPPIFDPDAYCEQGKVMDGWETRRRREAGHDWCLILLSHRAQISAIELDTAHFTGNHVPKVCMDIADVDTCTVERLAKSLPHATERLLFGGIQGTGKTPDEVHQAFDAVKDLEWNTLLPTVELSPGYENSRMHSFPLFEDGVGSLVRLSYHPDGGVARLKLWGKSLGEVKPSPKPLYMPIETGAICTVVPHSTTDQPPSRLLNEFEEVSSLELGGTGVSCSNKHYGEPWRLLQKNLGVDMGDGWETARHPCRPAVLIKDPVTHLIDSPLNDWAILKLGKVAETGVAQIILDTKHFRGNYPESVMLEGCYNPEDQEETEWFPLVPRTRMSPDSEHLFERSKEQVSNATRPVTHVRLSTYPDGGVSRASTAGSKEYFRMSLKSKLQEDRSHRICDSVLDVIGETPIVRLNTVASHLKCEIVAKCEFFNAGGSVKDRIGKRMIEDAEASGRLQRGDTLIEPTSGNTGIGIALAGAVKGYRTIITLPEKMSKEKVDILKALGAEIVRTPTEAAYDAPESHISVARRLNKDIPRSHILDQYENPSNPLAHYEGTAEEILRQCGGKVDMLVAGAGTGGTISGIAKRLKEHNPDIVIVGVDPEGSLLAQPENLNDANRLKPYHVEGIGYDFIPKVLDRSLVDEWLKSKDDESLLMMRRLIREEGLLCGGSSGAAVACAIKAAEHLKEGQRCVVILPDSVRNYMTKALSDDWMLDRGFVDNDVIQPKKYPTWWAEKRVCDMPIHTPLTITSDVSCKEAIALLKKEGYDMVPVLQNGDVVGVVTEGNMSKSLLAGRATPEASVEEAGVIYKSFHQFSMQDTLDKVASALDHEPFVLIATEQRCFTGSKKKRKLSHDSQGDTSVDTASVVSASDHLEQKCVISGIVTRIDLLDFVSQGSPAAQVPGSWTAGDGNNPVVGGARRS
eukprot:Nitzschia sp. Nitz4//scaffold10_size219509//34644//38143//NITZ4_001404-RA/size219509-snap-gene-0.359-mRNA-1//1//CDS//3329532848//7225//frame0